jgi:pSer/pThr/pTyr-binding forkhead associated (FHA) protein
MTDNKIVEAPVERSATGMIPRLEAVDWPLIGRTFYLDEPVVSIGRLMSNDICLEDPFASRHHCLIRKEGGQYVIEDLNSTNGTYVNGDRVNACSLKEGFLIRIGTARFEFRLPSTERAMAASQNLVSSDGGRPFSVITAEFGRPV